MYPSLPFGPISLPTGPLLAMLAAVVGLEVASRYARKLNANPDEIWNTGLIAIACGLIVARLWNVFQFRYIYLEQPLLVFSLRPSGFALWPGVIAAIVGGYAYLLWRAADPMRVGAALSIGLLAGASVLGVSAYLTGSRLGLPSSLPWALPYFGETRHPVGLYQAAAYAALTILLWIYGDVQRPVRIILSVGLGYSLVRLFVDGFVDGTGLLGSFRTSQIIAFAAALVFAFALARTQPTSTQRIDTEVTEEQSSQI